jgi:hypothetical protein
MMNHFMKFPDETTAKAALGGYLIRSAWDLSRVVPGQRVVLARAEWDDGDPENPIQISPPLHMPGWYVTVSLPEVDVTLRELPDNACRLIGDSDTGELVYTAPDLDMGLLTTAIIEPVPAGARYSFGGAA